MIKGDSIKKLAAMSTPIIFARGQYICFEGEPGNDMYIIIRGTVGVYISDHTEQLAEVARLGTGEIFGEMAVFDDLPRSASCIALDDVVCVSVGRDGLEKAVTECPDIALMLLKSLSMKLRRMNSELYKNSAQTDPRAFVFPRAYSYSHDVPAPPYEERFVQRMEFSCPMCGRNIKVASLKKYAMTSIGPEPDGRMRFRECDHLWHDVWSCPHCGYSNYYRLFFNVPEAAKDFVRELIRKNYSDTGAYKELVKTSFDRLVLSYLRAIHLNEIIMDHDNEMIGRLWRGLYYLCSDAGDGSMAAYCGRKAAERLARAFDEEPPGDDHSRRLLALSAADIFASSGDTKAALRMCELCEDGHDDIVSENAARIREIKIGKQDTAVSED